MLFLTEEGSILGLLTYMLYGDLLEIVSLNSLMWTRWGFTRGGGFDMARLFRNAMERSRQLKPEIPLIGEYGIALRHEIEGIPNPKRAPGGIFRLGLFSANDLPAVDKYHLYGGVAHHGIAVGDYQVSVLSNFQGTHPVSDTQVPGGIDGNGLEGGKGIHPGLDL